MPARTYWKGYLKLSLVTCPVAMSPATSESEKVRFHTLNRHTGNRVLSRYVDAESGKPVEADDQAKGYEAEAGRLVIVEDEELEAVRLDTVRTIDIDAFVPRDSIPWIYLDSPHYLVPDDEVGEEAFSVIRDAMAATKMIGISRVVLYRRERAVMIEPRDNGIVLWTLRYGDEVRDEKNYFSGIDKEKPAPELLALAQQFIATKTQDWSTEMVQDPVQEHLLKLIASKKRKGSRKSADAGEKGRPANVVNLFDALKKSLQADKTLQG
ncbi:DNA repair protein [Bosea sp. WAO]|uniref:non-homologous end joining protein Ku n=1 Tax=Bosea sp. WAO TaxID=406341 RepID=UPI0007464C98|nr:Ku protein [Bosea sp. WAO]KUL94350.1 DNA repair protein [Bosea sp. WAO]